GTGQSIGASREAHGAFLLRMPGCLAAGSSGRARLATGSVPVAWRGRRRRRVAAEPYTRPMQLPFDPPLEPMLATPSNGLPKGGEPAFEALLLRIHPAASRVKMLAEESPASFVGWDLLALGDEDLLGVPQADRRARLEAAFGNVEPPIHLTPATLDRTLAADWFDRFEGAGLDGV